MIPFILPNVLLIAEDSTMDEYARLVLPVLIPVFRVQEPIQVQITRYTLFSTGQVSVNSCIHGVSTIFLYVLELQYNNRDR